MIDDEDIACFKAIGFSILKYPIQGKDVWVAYGNSLAQASTASPMPS